MALHSAARVEDKLICELSLAPSSEAGQGRCLLLAPGSSDHIAVAPSGVPAAPSSHQADQFTKHERSPLRRADLDPADPIAQFHAWYGEAQAAQIEHAEACTLSTASLPSGRVSARLVYMKELDARGWVVYTNLGTSRKAADLFGQAAGDGSTTTTAGGGAGTGVPNPWAALTFWWQPLERQVRVEGRVERVPAAEGQAYFDTRARGSRVGAWASRQSSVLRAAPTAESPDDDGRAVLDGWVAEAEARFRDAGDQIPIPDFWGGIRVVPERVEFWQGRTSRLHDRFVYDRVAGGGGGGWTLERLSP
jgi:pyridoxamine 5'-phosphate oxidase